jgi:hypothetical protein
MLGYINPNGQSLEEYYVRQEDLEELLTWEEDDDLGVILFTELAPEDLIRISREDEE